MSSISVGIVTYRDNERLKKLFEALKNQTLQPLEILVIDAASEKETESLVRSQMLQGSSAQWKYLPSKNNLGENRGRVVAEAVGRFVVFIDSDCVPPRQWLQGLLTGFDSLSRKYDLAGVAGENIPSQESGFHALLRRMKKTFFGHFNSPQMKEITSPELVDHLPTTNALFLRESILAVNNFSVTQHSVCEDVELSYRLRRAGKKLFLLPQVEVAHDLPQGFISWSRRIFRFGKGRMQVALQYPDQTPLRIWLPAIAMILSLILVISALIWPALWLLSVVALVFILVIAKGSFSLAALIILTQLAYGAGQIAGLLTAALPKKNERVSLEP